MEELIEKIKNESDFISRARLIAHLRKEYDITLTSLASRLGMKPAYICHILRLNRLPDLIVDGYYAKLITISHLFIISRIKDEKKLKELYEQILTNNLTVSQTDEAVREILYQTKTKGSYLTSEELLQYINKLEQTFKNLQVKVIQTRIKGKIILQIKGSLEDSTLILKKILNKLTK